MGPYDLRSMAQRDLLERVILARPLTGRDGDGKRVALCEQAPDAAAK
jgi:hypothetical protein